MKHFGMTTVAMAVAGCLMAHGAYAQMSGKPVKIGVLTDLGGMLTENTGQGSVVAAQLAVEDFGGTVNGIPIEVLTADHQNKPEIGADIARHWYDDGVDMIVDVPNTGVALAVQKISQEKNRIVMFSGPAGSDLTGKACTAMSVHFTYDTYALAHVTGQALVSGGGKSWYFMTADYAFGATLERETTAVVTANGGTVVGGVRFPANNVDFSSVMMQAQQSAADVLAVASAGADTKNAISQAADFGIMQSNHKLAVLLLAIDDVNGLGLPVTQGILLTDAFYWDLNDDTRAFAKRFFARRGVMPNMYQAGVAGAVTHYLHAVKAAGSDQPEAVMAKMRELPVNDFMTRNGKLRVDGRVVRDMYLFQVKMPAESKGAWDYYKLVKVVPGDQAFRPLAESECPLVKK
jgi:branched-chain amino acid transport system substrate-binding protein